MCCADLNCRWCEARTHRKVPGMLHEERRSAHSLFHQRAGRCWLLCPACEHTLLRTAGLSCRSIGTSCSHQAALYGCPWLPQLEVGELRFPPEQKPCLLLLENTHPLSEVRFQDTSRDVKIEGFTSVPSATAYTLCERLDDTAAGKCDWCARLTASPRPPATDRACLL